MADWGDIPLGRQTDYVHEYDASLLAPIPRQLARDILGPDRSPFFGEDLWNAYELSWLDDQGKPVMAMAQFSVPCGSPCIIESKSLKLYLNSFAGSRFADAAQVQATLVTDLSAAAGQAVGVTLVTLDQVDALLGQMAAKPAGQCLDALPVSCEGIDGHGDSDLKTGPDEVDAHQVYTHGLRSLCPVTGQPDWATVIIRYSGAEIEPAGLFRYLVSYRHHSGFHEQVVEKIFCDLMRRCQPRALSVQALFTRRGGLDINPWRSTTPGPAPRLRMVRQ
ncbi:NADPH-dependent 7-cyano-7-deazaguanine reductase QueF [Isoalcanivorax indicus]|uniref:NADPH-dependent 7-cyano-7-deazaguanine reductase QueF n=1 Tax=Isoalcanivorax indicus TaxID=2202653 RepID=UPI000DBAD5C0|nr:NADPH-dependent 7-cyano-7-deazaguanine reductase QueF [Isoalcanivorax indicus]